ncbi:hypothetical protein BYT27DRAFT_7158431 [Phlegmacium glaucopus]|nr:hypothetical protein BYT27DRAFT_7158431 [Phlegmacium glaucopus]
MKVFSLYFLFLCFATVLASIQTPLTSTIVADVLDTSISDKIVEFQEAMRRVTTNTEAMLKSLEDIDLKEFQDRLDVELGHAFEELEKEFSEPPPENQAERYERQKAMITHALEIFEDALVVVCGHWKIPEDTVRTRFDDIKPYIFHGLLIVANYPVPVLILLGTAVIPKKYFFRPIFTFLGFGPLGPVKGSIAARAQSFFYGAAVPKGSWFAWLQSAGMTMGVRGLVMKIFWHATLRVLHP